MSPLTVLIRSPDNLRWPQDRLLVSLTLGHIPPIPHHLPVVHTAAFPHALARMFSISTFSSLGNFLFIFKNKLRCHFSSRQNHHPVCFGSPVQSPPGCIMLSPARLLERSGERLGLTHLCTSLFKGRTESMFAEENTKISF